MVEHSYLSMVTLTTRAFLNRCPSIVCIVCLQGLYALSLMKPSITDGKQLVYQSTRIVIPTNAEG